MLRYLLQRPIAVLIVTIMLTVAGIVALFRLPVSLLPDIDVPKIIIKIRYPNHAAATIEQNIVKPLRDKLITLNNLQGIESAAGNHSGVIYIDFEQGTKMELAYVEVNEKIDRMIPALPKEMERPQAIRVNTSDIPILRIQVIPNAIDDFWGISEMTEKVLKRRLEQIQGVSLVDINGKASKSIAVQPDMAQLSAAGMDVEDLAAVITGANYEIGGLSLRDGQYRYFVKMGNRLEQEADIARLPVRLKDGTIVSLSDLAQVEYVPDQPTGYHLYNGQKALVITVQKQEKARMTTLMPEIKQVVAQFRSEYPGVRFEMTQDQTFLLDAGINNLWQDLIYGGILVILVLFVFLGNYASPTLMSISLPLSLIITFAVFSTFGISLNIISLSGLALGIGMVIDNSIIVLDHITRKRKGGLKMLDSCVEGISEVAAPVTSQVLTTIAVYAPLILLSGIAGALVSDQAIALTISLAVSLGIAFVLAPLLYKLFLRTPTELLQEDSRFFVWILKGYRRMIHYIFNYKKIFFIITCLFGSSFLWLVTRIPVSTIPDIAKTETLLSIDWNDPIDVEENLKRTLELEKELSAWCKVSEADIGIRQFLLDQNEKNVQQTDIYCASATTAANEKIRAFSTTWLKEKYPSAIVQIADAPNAFSQLFSTDKPYAELRIYQKSEARTTDDKWKGIDTILANSPEAALTPGSGLLYEPMIEMEPLQDKMALYGIDSYQLKIVLERLFGEPVISQLSQLGDEKTIRFKSAEQTLEEKLNTEITTAEGSSYPLREFIKVNWTSDYKYITADKSGEYKSIVFEKKDNFETTLKGIISKAQKKEFATDTFGAWVESDAMAKQMIWIFLLALALLFLILAIQYENLVHPFVVLLNMPLGLSGALLVLWATGTPIDLMASIGFVIVLGIIVDDPILKVDTINRLRKQYAAMGIEHGEALEKAIHEAGEICLKPLLMTSLTTSLALVPILFTGGIGADLQRSMIYVVIGGLTLGTFLTTWFTPLAYWFFTKRKI